ERVQACTQGARRRRRPGAKSGAQAIHRAPALRDPSSRAHPRRPRGARARGPMIGKHGSAEIYAFCEPVDMRKGFEGLAGIVRNDMWALDVVDDSRGAELQAPVSLRS